MSAVRVMRAGRYQSGYVDRLPGLHAEYGWTTVVGLRGCEGATSVRVVDVRPCDLPIVLGATRATRRAPGWVFA